MRKIICLLMLAILSGCVSGDCENDCYLIKHSIQDLEHACTMDPHRGGCPINP